MCSSQSWGHKGPMARTQLFDLIWVLQSLRVSAGIPEVWVQVQMEATELASFSVRCGFLGSGSVSLVTISWERFADSGTTKLAVLHPEFGIQQWPPALLARWETPNSVFLTLEWSKAKKPLANTTFCCEFVFFPNGSKCTCGNLSSSDQVISDPAPVPTLHKDLAWILGVNGVLFGFVFILCLFCRQKHRYISKLWLPHASTGVQRPAQAASQAFLAVSHLPSTTTCLHPAALHMDTVHQDPSSLPASERSSFIFTENGLYARAGEGLPQSESNLPLSPNSGAQGPGRA